MTPSRNLEAKLCTAALLKMCVGGKMKEIATGMLAASSENPRLLEPVRHVVKDTLEKLQTTSEDPDASLLAWLAVEGLRSMEMHDISPFTDADRERLIEAIGRLLEKGIAEQAA
ncbi:hypothetical protein [Microvirga rosea]|uniref:hypothetical protein n=1 Tax=Microvirga rosea TaxID=2715425 RepID=UPI001D0BA353|nr:hypothetical protein [Microvirga rosea]MCB8819659.1 hypothetical protein [Microvirga rosea]